MLNHSLITRMATLATVVAGATLPAGAQAKFDLNPGSSTVTPAATVVPQSANSGDSAFDWGDAGIGAGGTIVLLSAGLGATGAVRRHRRALAR
jgi:hypothetical protein